MTPQTRKGPLTHRLLVFVFSVVFGLLFYWLLGFVMDDIGTLPGPNYAELEEQLLDQSLLDEEESLQEQVEDVERKVEQVTKRRGLLKDSIDNSQRTMSQLMEIQRLALEKDLELPPEQQTALSESTQLFLANQQQYQTYNDELAQLNEQLTGLEEQQRTNREQLQIAREPIYEEHRRLNERHKLWIGTLKLAVLIPLLVLIVVLFVKKRHTLFSPLIYAAGIATAVKIMFVMHETFPERYFKYILILVSLAIVTWILVHLLRMVAFPKRDWLLKQYREAYESFHCPICSYPIRRGPLKYLSWTRRSIRKVAARIQSVESEPDAPYTCPCCGTALFEECSSCHGIRHSLLPSCERCGATSEAVDASG